MTVDPSDILNQINDKLNNFIEKIGGIEKYNELTDKILSDRVSYFHT